MAYKIVTFSLDPKTIERLEKLKTWLHNDNKSGILTTLINREYIRQLELRDLDGGIDQD